MTRFFEAVVESFRIFSANPAFILPKLLVTLLYGALMLATASVSVDVFTLASTVSLEWLVVLLLVTLALNLVDVFVSAAYPYMVEQIKRGKKIDYGDAFSKVFARAGVFVPSVLAVEAILFVAAIIAAIVFSGLVVFAFLNEVEFEVFALGGLVLGAGFTVFFLALVFLFFLLFPVIAFEKNSALGSLRRSVSLSMNNRVDVAKATLLSSVVSLVSFGVAFLISIFPESSVVAFYWLAFILLRFLTAYLYSYLFVLNPVFYYKYVTVKK